MISLKDILARCTIFMNKNKTIFCTFQAATIKKFQINSKINSEGSAAFSLIELLMALLVASLLMAALTPVMTKKYGETVTINGTMPGVKVKTHEIEYNSRECSNLVSDNENGDYCEGEFIVPEGYNGKMTVTVTGAGGGGGAAAAAGYIEYTTAGSTGTFVVPPYADKIEATLISGGAGGGAGGQVIKTQTFVTSGTGGVTVNDNNKVTPLASGTGTWTLPAALRGKNGIVTGCGGGGGGGGQWWLNIIEAAGGGSGAYTVNKLVAFENQSTANIFIGGGGGGGGGDDRASAGAGRPYGGGAGGNENYSGQRIKGSSPGGDGGYSPTNTSIGLLFSIGGGGDRGVGGNGSVEWGSWKGGTGSVGGNGGSGGMNAKGLEYFPYGSVVGISGGAGGGSEGGGGGGGTSGCSGGGGGGATLIKQGAIEKFNVGGGGGAAGMAHESNSSDSYYIWTGGGGGGGIGGGAGGGGTGGGEGGTHAAIYGRGGTNGVNGSENTTGGTISTIWGGTYCAGGDGAPKGADGNGKNGHDGALTIKYLDYGPGGSGGGSSSVVPIQPVNVAPNESLTVKIGAGTSGGSAGAIENSGTIRNAKVGGNGRLTGLYRGSNILIRTNMNYPEDAQDWHAPIGGIPSGGVETTAFPSAGYSGWVHKGTFDTEGIYGITVKGFSNENGHTAGNTTFSGDKTYANGTVGGDGGKTVTPWFTCTPGKGGTLSNPKGGDASGYGCGGGGGYGLADGGKGSGGYARISWNKYWDVEAGDYRLNNSGAGGGGASGNVMKYTVDVKSGEVIKIRIGKGGAGGYMSGNVFIAGKKGGDSVFAYNTTRQISAGGGGGGVHPTIEGIFPNLSAINGIGGAVSTLCKYNNSDKYENGNYCTKGSTGKNAHENKGGAGANLIGYGTGGVSREAGSGLTDGFSADDCGTGGAGASLRDMGSGDSSNPTRGGNGGNGKIVIQWYE